jgi:hypothetical protein
MYAIPDTCLHSTAGIILSGPPMVFLVEHLKPQPGWVDAETFIANFHWLQTLPYWFGFILIIGNVLFIVSAGRLSSIRDRIQSSLSVICAGIYGSLVSINYAIQIAFVPAMVSDSNQILEFVSMVNPKSICWILEMFAYAILGIAYWLVSIAFQGKGILNIIKYLMIFNGIASLLGVLIPVFDPELLLESESIMGYVLWNVLIVLIMSLILIAFRKKNNLKPT